MNQEPTQKKSRNESRIIRKVAFLAFGLNLVLAILKGILAVLSGSLAVSASAIDSATDSVASLAVFIGVNLSEKKSQTFPLGLYKIENVISVVIALFIFLGGYEIATRVLQPGKKIPEISLPILVLMLFSTLAIYLFGQYALSTGRKTGSPTLMAEGRHRQVDVLSSIVVLVSVSLNYFKLNCSFWGIGMDQIAAAVVLLFIAKAGWDLLSEGMRVLLDASIAPEKLEIIKNTIKNHPLVTKVRNVVASNAGRFIFIQAEIELRTADLEKAHHTSEEIEKNIQEKIPRVSRVIIHYEPTSTDKTRLALPVMDLQGNLNTNFGEAPYFAFVDLEGEKQEIVEHNIRSNQYHSHPKGRGIKVANWLVEQKVDQIILKEDIAGKGPAYLFENAGINIITTEKKNLTEVLREQEKNMVLDT